MVNMAPVEVTFRPEGEYWLAFCPALDVAQGNRMKVRRQG